MRPTMNLRDVQEMEHVLSGMVKAGAMKEADRLLPPLYKSGIRYVREGRENWQLPWETFQRGKGDCEDLALYRASELVREGIDPSARVIIVRTGPVTLHAIVERGDGTREDPSRALGMVSLGNDPSAVLPPGQPQPLDAASMLLSLYPGAGLVLQLLRDPRARKLLYIAARKIGKWL